MEEIARRRTKTGQPIYSHFEWPIHTLLLLCMTSLFLHLNSQMLVIIILQIVKQEEKLYLVNIIIQNTRLHMLYLNKILINKI